MLLNLTTLKRISSRLVFANPFEIGEGIDYKNFLKTLKISKIQFLQLFLLVIFISFVYSIFINLYDILNILAIGLCTHDL